MVPWPPSCWGAQSAFRCRLEELRPPSRGPLSFQKEAATLETALELEKKLRGQQATLSDRRKFSHTPQLLFLGWLWLTPHS